MSRCIIGIFLFFLVVQPRAKVLATNRMVQDDVQDSMDQLVEKLIEKLVDRLFHPSLKVSLMDHKDLDDSTLASPGNFLMRRGGTFTSPWTSYRPLIPVDESSGPRGLGQDTGARLAGLGLDRMMGMSAERISAPESLASSASRRDTLVHTLGLGAAAAITQGPGPAEAKKGSKNFLGVKKREKGLNEPKREDFKPIPGTNPTVLYFDLQGGGGSDGGVREGERVAVHYDLKWRKITIGTSRQGAGVTGGTPYGFDVGTGAGKPGGPFIKAFNIGIRGMRPGTVRRLIVPPEYAYGSYQMQEIPPNSEIVLDIELLSVKRGSFY